MDTVVRPNFVRPAAFRSLAAQADGSNLAYFHLIASLKYFDGRSKSYAFIERKNRPAASRVAQALQIRAGRSGSIHVQYPFGLGVEEAVLAMRAFDYHYVEIRRVVTVREKQR